MKGFFLNAIYKELWGMAHHKASARFFLDRTVLIDQRRCRSGRNPDAPDDELAAERAAEDPAINVVIRGGRSTDTGGNSGDCTLWDMRVFSATATPPMGRYPGIQGRP